jgi:hypothetical protein
VARRRNVAWAEVAAHRHARQAERKVRGERRERGVGALAAGRGIRDDSDVMTALCLAAGEIADMAEQAAYG